MNNVVYMYFTTYEYQNMNKTQIDEWNYVYCFIYQQNKH